MPSDAPELSVSERVVGRPARSTTPDALCNHTESTWIGTMTTAADPMTARGRRLMIVYAPSRMSDSVIGPTGAGGTTTDACGADAEIGDSDPRRDRTGSTPLSGATQAAIARRPWVSFWPGT